MQSQSHTQHRPQSQPHHPMSNQHTQCHLHRVRLTMNSQHALMVSVTCTLLYRVPSSVTHDPIVTRLQLATYSDLSSHTPLVVRYGLTSHTMSLKLAGSTPNRLRPQAPPHPVLPQSSLGPGLSGPCLCLQDRHSGSTSESGGGQGAVEAERTQRKRFVLCGQVIKGSGRPSASPSPPTEEQNSSYF